jgi:hypothetical protein
MGLSQMGSVTVSFPGAHSFGMRILVRRLVIQNIVFRCLLLLKVAVIDFTKHLCTRGSRPTQRANASNRYGSLLKE